MTDSQEEKRSVCGDLLTLKERIKEEAGGKHPALLSRFSFKATLFFYWIYFFVIFWVVSFFFLRLYPNYQFEAAIWGGITVFFAGHIFIAGTFFCKKKFGALAEMMVSTATRTGIPLMMVLVFYFSIDKILFKMTILTLVVFYLVTLPFEVWVFLPRKKMPEKSTKGVESSKN